MVDINYSKERRKLLEKQLGDKLDGLERLLLEYKIVPLFTSGPLKKRVSDDETEPPRHGLTSFIGQGKYGTVLRAVYNGKQVAVKITSEPAEADNWQRISQISESMPSNLKRHLPKIYKIIRDDQQKVGQPNYIIVMEVLAPLPAHLKEKLFVNEGDNKGTQQEFPLSKKILERTTKGKQESVIDLMKDVNKLFEAFKSVVESVQSQHSMQLPGPLKQDLFKRIIDFKPLSQGATPLLDFPIFVATALSQLVGALPPPQKEELLLQTTTPMQALGFQIGDDMIKYFRNLAKGGEFPWTAETSEDERDVYRQMPESKSLLDALEYLEANGMGWHDIHSGNLMVRPSTGDPVIIDVGLYHDQNNQ